jgi:hypothetical protein
MKSEILLAVSIKILLFWGLKTYNFVSSCQRFDGDCCLHLQVRGIILFTLSLSLLSLLKKLNTKLHVLSPQVNYTD